jgi:hypothetical protein
VREFPHERIQRHAVLPGQTRQRANAVHEAANGGTFLGHGDEQFAGLAVVKQTDREIAFVTGDIELMRDRGARVRQAAAQRFAHFVLQPFNFRPPAP